MSSTISTRVSLQWLFLLVFCINSSVVFASSLQPTSGKKYYVNAATGKDANPGPFRKPFKGLNSIDKLLLGPGDTVFLAAGSEFKGSLELKNVKGAAGNPVVITTYGIDRAGARHAFIDAAGHHSGVYIVNCSFVEVSRLSISANGGGMIAEEDKNRKMRCGVLVTTDAPGLYQHIVLNELSISDVYFENPGFVRDPKEVRTENGTQSYGWGIRFITTTNGAVLKDMSVRNSTVKRVSHTGIKITANGKSIENILVAGNEVTQVGGPGIQMSGVAGGLISENKVDGSGSNADSRHWARGSGLWTWGTSDVLIEKNQFLNARGPGDSAGAHIDFNCNNIILQYNLSVNNAGGFCEILGNNHNCAYRYNVSINDGWRIKGQEGAFQEGKIFWLSGYIGNKNKPYGPFNSYFYNNTIFVKNEMDARFAVASSAKGVCIVNNIFYIEGNGSEVKGDQLVADQKASVPIERVVFENNLYLHKAIWPSSLLLQDVRPLYGNPGFVKAGGLDIADYVPTNTALIRNRGIEVPVIPGDSIGLVPGLKVEWDIMGNMIVGKPGMGAIHLL
jgi:hypothetical protein